jgi:hypothetical protein
MPIALRLASTRLFHAPRWPAYLLFLNVGTKIDLRKSEIKHHPSLFGNLGSFFLFFLTPISQIQRLTNSPQHASQQGTWLEIGDQGWWCRCPHRCIIIIIIIIPLHVCTRKKITTHAIISFLPNVKTPNDPWQILTSFHTSFSTCRHCLTGRIFYCSGLSLPRATGPTRPGYAAQRLFGIPTIGKVYRSTM